MASIRSICRVLGVARSALYRHHTNPPATRDVPADADVAARIKELIEEHPTYGYRRIWARLRFGDGRVINGKKVRRLTKAHGGMVCQRPAGPEATRTAQAERSNAQERTVGAGCHAY